MIFKTIFVEYTLPHACTITFNRLECKNSINAEFLSELNQALDEVLQLSECRMIILQGQQGVFCTGMDFKEASSRHSSESFLSSHYMQTIKRLTLIPRIVIAKVEGQVMAGGVGIVAAADLVIATPDSSFCLSEALWGLLPACVTPYLIRRIGFQHAYRMALTTLAVNGEKAKEMNLVDELTESPDKAIRQLTLRLGRLENTTIADVKQYFRKMWIITEEMEQVAVDEISRLANSPQIQLNIERFVKYQQFPWDKE